MKAPLVAVALTAVLSLAAAFACGLTPHMVAAVEANELARGWLIALWASNWLVRLLPALCLVPSLISIIAAARVASSLPGSRRVLSAWLALTPLALVTFLLPSRVCAITATMPVVALGFAASIASAVLATRIQAQLFTSRRSTVPAWRVGAVSVVLAFLGPAMALPALWVWLSAAKARRAQAGA